MANKQQFSFSFAFLAAAMILLAGQATARRELLDANVEVDLPGSSTLETVLNELIAGTQHAKAKVANLGNSRMIQDCDKAYALSLDSLNKAMGLVKGTSKDSRELKATILEALKAYESCDKSFAQSSRPSPFIPNNTQLKFLGAQCLELSSKQAKNN